MHPLQHFPSFQYPVGSCAIFPPVLLHRVQIFNEPTYCHVNENVRFLLEQSHIRGVHSGLPFNNPTPWLTQSHWWVMCKGCSDWSLSAPWGGNVWYCHSTIWKPLRQCSHRNVCCILRGGEQSWKSHLDKGIFVPVTGGKPQLQEWAYLGLFQQFCWCKSNWTKEAEMCFDTVCRWGKIASSDPSSQVWYEKQPGFLGVGLRSGLRCWSHILLGPFHRL